MARLTSRTFAENDLVTHYFLGGRYLVDTSGPRYTQVVTADEDGIDISFPTEDLIPAIGDDD